MRRSHRIVCLRKQLPNMGGEAKNQLIPSTSRGGLSMKEGKDGEPESVGQLLDELSDLIIMIN